MNVYEMVIANTAKYIRSVENRKNIEQGIGIDAFQASIGIGIGFCKHVNDVVMDIVTYKEK